MDIHATKNRPPATKPAEQRPLRVLVVDSDRPTRRLLATLFRRKGFETVLVPHGPAAMRIVEDDQCETFDGLVVQCAPVASPTDPSVSLGLAFLAALAERRPQCLAYTIILTTITRQVPASFSDVCKVVTQPFDIDQLTEVVGKCARRGRATRLSKAARLSGDR